jgi:hypothetical protein
MVNHRYAMQITIGGILKSSHLDSFFAAIEREGVSYDWDEGPFADSPDHLRELIAAEGGAGLRMRDSAHAGRFDDLEAFCIEHGLTFVVHSSASDEVDAELRWWAPGYQAVQWSHSLENGSPAFTQPSILEVLGEGTCSERLDRLEAWLASRTPPVVPPLRIEEDASPPTHPEVSRC